MLHTQSSNNLVNMNKEKEYTGSRIERLITIKFPSNGDSMFFPDGLKIGGKMIVIPFAKRDFLIKCIRDEGYEIKDEPKE